MADIVPDAWQVILAALGDHGAQGDSSSTV
jgi:hypothetical protein